MNPRVIEIRLTMTLEHVYDGSSQLMSMPLKLSRYSEPNIREGICWHHDKKPLERHNARDLEKPRFAVTN
jgi:hypothetical protein